IRLPVIQPKETEIWEKSLAAAVERSVIGGCKSHDSNYILISLIIRCCEWFSPAISLNVEEGAEGFLPIRGAATVREGEDFGGSKSLRRRRSLILGVKSGDYRGEICGQISGKSQRISLKK
ncbi:hypothetical protein U1Q18_034123, partial [Sarracenia purpurea var. burkii]